MAFNEECDRSALGHNDCLIYKYAEFNAQQSILQKTGTKIDGDFGSIGFADDKMLVAETPQ